jgi:hypothetical protein
MDIGSSSELLATSRDSSGSISSQEEREVPPPKKPRVSTPVVSRRQLKHRATSKSSSRKYQKKWEKDFTWLEYDADCDGAFCKLCKTSGKSLERTGGVWTTKQFTNWKKAVEKMKAHAKSDAHIRAIQASLAHQASLHAGSVIQQLQNVAEQERATNRKAVKSFFRCAHFLARQHIPHTTNFEKLVELTVLCGGEDLKNFLEEMLCTLHM